MTKEPVTTMPVNLLIGGQPCLVVGGGAVATRKVGHLRAAGAIVTVVAPDVTPALIELADQENLILDIRTWQEDDIQGQAVVFAATDDPAVNLAILNACRQKRVLCCLVDHQWPQGDFITPAIVRQGELTTTVSLGGCDPQRVRKLKVILEELVRSGE